MAASAGKPKWKYIVALGRTDFLQTAQPHANEAIWTREVSRQLENHLTRINHAQPSIDTSVPKTAANVSTGSKKNQLKEDRLDAIEIENRRLLDRIASIALSTTKDSVDAPSNHPTVKKSLHEGQRKREQQKIWLENQVSVIVHLKANKSSGIAETIAIGQVDHETSERRKGREMETAPKDNDGHDYYDEFEEDAHEAEPPVAMIAAEVADVRGRDLPVDLLADNGTSTATAASTVTPLDSKAELDVKFERIHATAIAIVTAATDEAVKTKSVHKEKATQHQHALDHTIVSTNHHDIEAQPAVDCTDETSIGDGLATANTEQLLPAAFDPSSNLVHATYTSEGAKVAGVSTIGTTNQDGPTTDENVTSDYADIRGDGGSRIHDSNDTQSMGGGVSSVNSTDETTYEQCPPINVDNSSRNLDGRSMPLPTAFLMHCDSLTRGHIANHEPLENALDSSPSTSPAEYFSGHDDDGFEPESPPEKSPSPLSFRHDVTDDEQDYNDEFEEDAAKVSDEAPVPPSEPGDIATSWALEESVTKHEYYDDDFDNK
ncbi:hypothetical protein B5M09_007564 [Aphanomyces astaci]|uniref:Uncharacterized protein n=1 Tax=Aphanomyces astaci TaxID=112090 RepID=A0A3R7WJX8_APHAT|nr:hypothetical protein B5M09_007564 [Aphanomyces astaci]